MASCKVKRTCEVLLSLSEEEAQWLKSLLCYVHGGHRCHNAIESALAQVVTSHSDESILTGQINWKEDVPF